MNDISKHNSILELEAHVVVMVVVMMVGVVVEVVL